MAEIPAFMVDLRAREGLAARALELAILTVCRRGEVLGARWQEIVSEGVGPSLRHLRDPVAHLERLLAEIERVTREAPRKERNAKIRSDRG